jgi:uncharacterized SAM-binding protein YcdF (DUF218 family)
MFFILSKVLTFIISPFVWLVCILTYAIFSKNKNRKKKAFMISFIILIFFSNTFIFEEVMRSWEIPAIKYEELPPHDVGIVLGGLLSYDRKMDRVQYNRGTDRLLQAVELYKKGKIEKIFFVGGSGSLVYKDTKEAPLVSRFLLTIGIPEKDLIFEGESRNTHENALFAKQILDQKSISGKYLLITSGFHMKRSIGCFQKQGITVTPFSADRYCGPRRFAPDILFLPSPAIIVSWENLIHEIVGYYVYKIAGYA